MRRNETAQMRLLSSSHSYHECVVRNR